MNFVLFHFFVACIAFCTCWGFLGGCLRFSLIQQKPEFNQAGRVYNASERATEGKTSLMAQTTHFTLHNFISSISCSRFKQILIFLWFLLNIQILIQAKDLRMREDWTSPKTQDNFLLIQSFNERLRKKKYFLI